MTVQRETYSELAHSMIFAYAGAQLTMPQVASVLYACAQPDTTENTTDLTHDVRDALTDWSEQDKGMLIAVEHVEMKFRCVNIHGPCKKGEHTVNMTRVIGSMDWEPEMVSSVHDFNDVIMDCMHIPRREDGTIDGKLIPGRKGGRGDLISAFKKIFETESPIEQEVKDFRAELDALFPSAPNPHTKGGSDDST